MPGDRGIIIDQGGMMIQRILCWFFGHKTVYKAFTGEMATITQPLGYDARTPVTKWERSKFCLRCGKPVHDED